MTFAEHKEIAETVKNYAEAIGFGCGAGFFIYKFVSGYLLSNLSLSVTCNRCLPHSNGKNMLSIAVHLEKGDRNTILLHHIQARVTYDDHVEILTFNDTERRRMKRMDKPKRQTILWNTRSKKAPMLRLSPGEETDFSVFCSVPQESVCKVEVVILAPKPFSRTFGQWRASCVSMPTT